MHIHTYIHDRSLQLQRQASPTRTHMCDYSFMPDKTHSSLRDMMKYIYMYIYIYIYTYIYIYIIYIYIYIYMYIYIKQATAAAETGEPNVSAMQTHAYTHPHSHASSSRTVADNLNKFLEKHKGQVVLIKDFVGAPLEMLRTCAQVTDCCSGC